MAMHLEVAPDRVLDGPDRREVTGAPPLTVHWLPMQPTSPEVAEYTIS